MTSSPDLSVVIPFYNEAPNVATLLAELRTALEAMAISVEVVAVNDGSADDTRAEINRVEAEWPAVRAIHFVQNRGQAAGLWYGFHQCRGNWIAMLDGDGQNPPAELAKLWALRESADMISGARVGRQDSALRRTMSRIANTTRRALLHDGVTDTGCSLKIFHRDVIHAFVPMRTMYSFIPAFAVAAGWTVREVPVAHRARRAGVSKYGLRVMAIMPLLDLLSLWWLLRRRVKIPRKP